MEYLQSLWSHIGSIQIADILDIILVAFIIYKIIGRFLCLLIPLKTENA